MTAVVLACLLLQSPSLASSPDNVQTGPAQQTSPTETLTDSIMPKPAGQTSTPPTTELEATSPLQGDQGEGQNSIVVTAIRRETPGDPLQSVNIKSFEMTYTVDKAVFRSVALAYRHGLPRPVRSGLRNILTNLNEPVVFANYLLQHHPGKAAETFGRFTINSVIGVAGLFDVAKTHRFNLPHRPNGFADTLGFYGVRSGPFLYLPLIGPSSARDLFGDVVDRLTLPLSVGRPFNRLAYSVPTTAIRLIDRRAEFDDRLQRLHEDPAHAYTTSRALYLQARQAEIDALHARHRSE
ncbi:MULTISPECIES: VacJ family lipoprotein [Sphingomonas]|jgi:phospholipid-binding lipoprotein MlaA|uniref:MlaA family lipoprotein n=1 Tax=Sphingomonas TaxID=13687 RepID=UPI000DB11978|nr:MULTISPECIES: VacJ family lipoprotein [Sphingomonas]MDF0490175.1 VacJ family lipoprotein [Sphingomonas pollutisoli]PZU08236.1 MAG: ABC transporter [Sphingomonas sp.]